MSKFNLSVLMFALSMCLFVGIGSVNYRLTHENVQINEGEVPLASGSDISVFVDGNENLQRGFRITDSIEIVLRAGKVNKPVSFTARLYGPNGATLGSCSGKKDSEVEGRMVGTLSPSYSGSTDLEGCTLIVEYSYEPKETSSGSSRGSDIFQVDNFSVASSFNPNDKPVFDFGGLTSSSVLDIGETVTVAALHSNSYSVKGVYVYLQQNGKTVSSNEKGGSILYTTSGTKASRGYQTTINVPSSIQYGVKTTIKVVAECLPHGGSTTVEFSDSIVCNTGSSSSDKPGVNPYSNIKFYVNGSENPTSISIYNSLNVSVSTSLSVHQLFVSVYDTSGNLYYQGSDYDTSHTIKDFSIFAKGKSLTKNTIEMTVVDTKSNKYTYKLQVNFVDDKVLVPSKGNFKYIGETNKQLVTNDIIGFNYTCGKNENVNSVTVSLVDEDTGRVITEYSNKKGGSNITTLDVTTPIDSSAVYNHVKIVCKANVSSGDTWIQEYSGYSLNINNQVGVIRLDNSVPNYSSVKPGDKIKFLGITDTGSTLKKFEVDVEQDGKIIDRKSFNLNSYQYEFIYQLSDNAYGSYIFYVTVQGISKGKTMEPVSGIYHYEVGSEVVDIEFDCDIKDGSQIQIDSLIGIGTKMFVPYVTAKYKGSGYMQSIGFELRSRGSSNYLKKGTLQSGQFLDFEGPINAVNTFFQTASDATGDFTLLLIGKTNDGKEIKKEINFSVIKKGDNEFKWTITPESGYAKLGDVVSFSCQTTYEKLVTLEYKLFGEDGSIYAEGKAAANLSDGNPSLNHAVKLDFNGNKESRNVTLKLIATDTKGKTSERTCIYTITNLSSSGAGDTNIEKDKKTFRPKDNLSFSIGGDSSNVKVELLNKKTNKVITTKNSGEGSFTLPNDEGTYVVRVTKKDSQGFESSEDHTYFVVDGGNVVDLNNQENLSVDLWIDSDERYFAPSKNIPMKLYYMNNITAEYSDVSIKLSLPEGFKASGFSSNASYKDGVITIGKVPETCFDVITFNLVASSVKSENLDNKFQIRAAICEGSNEKDVSMTELFIYKEGTEGNSKGYITGYPDGTIRADSPITRGEVATIFTRAFDLKSQGSPTYFTDLKSTQWAYEYVQNCAQNSIITGYTDGSFKPNENITINELATMIYRVTKIDINSPLIVTPKYAEKNTWEKNYIVGLERLNMLDSLNVQDTGVKATRGEVIHLVNEALFLNPDETFKANYKDLSDSHKYSRDISIASQDFDYKRTSQGNVKVK